MALDLWLLEQHRLGLHPPALRLYTWSPAAISLGYHQQRYPDFWSCLTWNNAAVDLVRRPSGGRAVLHQGDLTYAVIVSGMPGNRMLAYQAICQILIRGWRSLGVELHYGEAGRGYIHNPNCFETATGADLVTSDSIKLIGSAQLRRGDALLQHGSMRLAPDRTLFRAVFGREPDPLVLPLAATGEALVQIVSEAIVASASQWFGGQPTVQPLSQAEWQAVFEHANREPALSRSTG